MSGRKYRCQLSEAVRRLSGTRMLAYEVILMRHRLSDEMSEFDMQQMLLLEEGTLRYRPLIGRAGARQRAVDEMPLVFDSPALETAARGGDPLLPSSLAMILGGVASRSDWSARRLAFAGAARDAHIAEARRRVAARSAVAERGGR
jgi:hypothetical protein